MFLLQGMLCPSTFSAMAALENDNGNANEMQWRQKQLQLSTDFRFLVALPRESPLSAHRIHALMDAGLDLSSINMGLIYKNISALHYGARIGDVELVTVVLQVVEEREGAEAVRRMIVEGTEDDGDTAIHDAVLGEKIEILKMLLAAAAAHHDRGSGSDHRRWWVEPCLNRWGQSPLHYAAGKGEVEMVKLLVERGRGDLVDVRDNVEGASALHFAARCGEVSVMDALLHLQPGLDLLQTNNVGMTAAHYAAWNAKLNVLEWLVRNKSATVVDRDRGGAVLDLLLTMPTAFGFTPLHMAAKRAIPADMLVEAMLWTGISAYSSSTSPSVLELIEAHGPRYAQKVVHALQDNDHVGNLYVPDLVKFVVEYGDAFHNEKMVNDFIYASSAIIQSDPVSTDPIPSLFSQQHSRPYTMMDYAAIKGNVEALPSIIRLLGFILPHELDDQMASALNQALLHKQMDFAVTLGKQHYRNHNLGPIWIKTIKDYLARNVDPKLIKEVKKAANGSPGLKSDEDIQRELPLAYLMISSPHLDSIANFIDQTNSWGQIINENGPLTGRTALHWAAIVGKKDMITKLCSMDDCRLNIKDAYGKNAYEYAVEYQHDDIQKEMGIQSEEVRNYIELLYKDRQIYVDALNAILVGAALISSITFTGFLQPPLAYPNMEYVAIGKQGMKAFWIFNGFSFFFGISSALVGARGVLPMPDIFIGKLVTRIRRILFMASTLLVISIAFVVLAFGTAGFVVLPPSLKYESLMIGTTTIGGTVCALMLVWFARGLTYLKPIAWHGGLHGRILGQQQAEASSSTAEEDQTELPLSQAFQAYQPEDVRVGTVYPWKDFMYQSLKHSMT